MAVLLEMKGVAFKPRAFEKAVFSINTLSEDVEGVGPKMIKKQK
jgi:hypothetical protein